MAMSLISEQEAVNNLYPHISAIREIVVGGWNDYIEKYPEEVRVLHCPTTRAGIVHDHQIHRASIYAQKASGVTLCDLTRLKMLIIDGKFAIRFKKLDNDLRSANLKTKQIREFRSQEQLCGLPQTHNLEAGYLLSELETEIQNVFLVCPNKGGLYWAAKLEEHSKVEQTIFDLFENFQGMDETDEEEEVGIRPKEDNVIPLRNEGKEK